jgi:hypothetical protein
MGSKVGRQAEHVPATSEDAHVTLNPFVVNKLGLSWQFMLHFLNL